MKIKVGTLDMIYHGSFLIERGKSFEFDIPDEGKPPMKLIFFITEDKNEKAYSIKSRLVDETTLELNLINFDNNSMSGGGLTEPIKIGILNERAFYFSFHVSITTKTVMPVFTYTFYLGEKEVENVK